ncbi:MAG TPA: ATP-binding protein, partial [Acidimicrobiales bacterium]|nr:ATP-binding protein [Acidimicrobiales bacterium]
MTGGGRRPGLDIDQILARGGTVGADLLRVDWASTPLGPPSSWPESLKTMVSVLLTSRFSMWMAWGEELTFFCNDAYRIDTLGAKYPWALGRPAAQVWAEIWPDIGPRIESVIRTGEATWDEALQLFLERSGYPEETYHTFSYSPLADDDGVIAGMLCVVSEETDRVVAERRMATLGDLASAAAALGSEQEVVADVVGQLRGRSSTPFALLYLFDDGCTTARLAAVEGLPTGHRAAVEQIDIDEPDCPWPLAEVRSGRSVIVDGLADHFGAFPDAGLPGPPVAAFVQPLRQQGRNEPTGGLVVGINPYRPFDAEYRSFMGLVAGHIGTAITSARAYEAERRRAEALAALDQAKTAFFTNVSHEFRTPLTLLLGPTEDALADADAPLGERQRQRLEMVHRNALRLLQLVNTLLDFSRLESGRTAAHFEPTDLVTETTELVSMFRAAVERAGLDLQVSATPLPRPVVVDRDMWAKVVMNLLSNALKFTLVGGITVELRDGGDHVELVVGDTGVGIEDSEQTRLFERFHRVVGVTGRTHEGSGIGLALVAELVDMHGGTVSVTSESGRGSTFTVRIPYGRSTDAAAPATEGGDTAGPVSRPLAQGFVDEALRWLDEARAADGFSRATARAASGDDTGAGPPANAGAGDPGGRRASPGRGRARVLVVDDNADMRAYIAHLLEDDYLVESAADGLAALDKARHDPPDLVLTDVMMPGLDGFGLLSALREDPRTTGVPVVMLSARAG